MAYRRLTFSLAAVFAALCLYYRQSVTLLPTLLLPIAAHELSHLLALRLCKLGIAGLSLEPQGLCIRYRGGADGSRQIIAALAGPLGGLVYALLASSTRISWLRDSADLSLLLTAFNLLPIRPLDGGRVFSLLCVKSLGAERGTRLCRSVSAVLLSLLLFGGVALALWKKSTPPLAAAIWLLLFRNEEEGLVKSAEIR